jgi:hypothetical protein
VDDERSRTVLEGLATWSADDWGKGATAGPLLIQALQAVLALHVPVSWPEQALGMPSDKTRPMCAQICGEWPCHTRRVVDEALQALA